MSHSLNSLKGGYIGDYLGDYYRHYKGDTRSLDYSSKNDMPQKSEVPCRATKFRLLGDAPQNQHPPCMDFMGNIMSRINPGF